MIRGSKWAKYEVIANSTRIYSFITEKYSLEECIEKMKVKFGGMYSKWQLFRKTLTTERELIFVECRRTSKKVIDLHTGKVYDNATDCAEELKLDYRYIHAHANCEVIKRRFEFYNPATHLIE